MRRFVADLNLPVEVVMVPICREESGLARNSRNVYLACGARGGPRALAQPAQGKGCFRRRGALGGATEGDHACRARDRTRSRVWITDGSLYISRAAKPIRGSLETSLLAIAVYIGKTRLIDNVIFTPSSGESGEMMLSMLKGKIHCATVTEANLAYMGSITIDEALMEAAGILANERVQVVDNNNGARLETYADPKGRAALRASSASTARRRGSHKPGDIVIIMAYATQYTQEEAAANRPTVVLVDEKNRVQRRCAISRCTARAP